MNQRFRTSATALLALGLLTAGLAAGVPTADPNDDPRILGGELVLLPMDDDDHNSVFTTDRSGNSIHGDLTGVAQAAGKFGMGYDFTVEGDWISLDDGSTSNMPVGTLMFWVKLDSYTGGAKLFVKNNPGVTTELAVLAGGGKITFSTSQDGGSTALTSVGTVPTGQWTHIAVTWGAGKKIYINGNQDASNGDNVGVGSASSETMIGNDPNAASTRGTDGTMDEFRIFNRVLSASEIQDIKDKPYEGDTIIIPPCPNQPSNAAPNPPTILKPNGMGAGQYGWAGYEYVFNGQSGGDPDGDPVSLSWTYGDGTTGSGPATVHAFEEPGTYTVTLTATDNPSARNQPAPCVPLVAKKTSVTYTFIALEAWTADVVSPDGQSCVAGTFLPGPGTPVVVSSCKITAEPDLKGAPASLVLKVVFTIDEEDAKEDTSAPYTWNYDSLAFRAGIREMGACVLAKNDVHNLKFCDDEPYRYLNVGAGSN